MKLTKLERINYWHDFMDLQNFSDELYQANRNIREFLENTENPTISREKVEESISELRFQLEENNLFTKERMIPLLDMVSRIVHEENK